MSALSLFLLIIFLLGVTAFFRLSLWIGAVLLLGTLSVLYYWALLGISAILIGIVVLSITVLLYIPAFRFRLFSRTLFDWFKKILPKMSETEKAAIDAGNVGFEKELFQGSPDWKSLLEFPESPMSHEERHFLDNQVENLCALLNDWEIVHERSDLSPEAWEYIKKEKFFGIIIPKEYGGLGFSVRAHSEIIVKIATRSVSAAVTIMVPNSLGPAELLLHYGTDEQKNNFLPKLSSGEDIPCFALTSPEAGSDAGSMQDKGVVCKEYVEGKEVLGIRLSFDKRYITLAPVATLVGVAFKLSDPDGLLGQKKNIGITLALIPSNHPGVEIGERHFPLNLAFMNGPIRANNIFIPLDWIIGGAIMAGQGWRMLMECLSAGRGISLPALSTATAVLGCRMSSAYASIRKQFKLPIASFEGVEEALARIVGDTYLLQSTRLFTIFSIDKYQRPSVATAIAKYHMTELSRQVVNDAMDIHAGRGIMLGPMNYLGRGYQAMPVSITVEGANILTRNLIIFGQGAIRCHPYATEEMMAAEEENLGAFDALLMKHVGYFISNKVRCFVFSWTRGLLCLGVTQDFTKKYIKKLTWLSTALAFTSDLALMTLGGKLKRRERLSARLGDVLSQLYLATSALKYYVNRGRPVDDEPVLRLVLQTACYKAQEAFYGFFDNAPNPLLGIVLKRFIFPFGRAFSLPNDKLTHQVAKCILNSKQLREDLTYLCYIGEGEDDPTGLMEMTFQKLKKLDDDSTELEEYEALRKKAIAVDAFSKDYPLGAMYHE